MFCDLLRFPRKQINSHGRLKWVNRVDICRHLGFAADFAGIIQPMAGLENDIFGTEKPVSTGKALIFKGIPVLRDPHTRYRLVKNCSPSSSGVHQRSGCLQNTVLPGLFVSECGPASGLAKTRWQGAFRPGSHLVHGIARHG